MTTANGVLINLEKYNYISYIPSIWEINTPKNQFGRKENFLSLMRRF